MERACQADNEARVAGNAAVHKLKLLPQVNAILNRNNVQHAVLDPDTNFLLHVKFFLEPLNDGSLPAYNIQRDIFTALTKLNIEKEALLSSGIGKVVLFYTRSKKPEPNIKRMAERLLGEWSRPILKRTDDYKKRHVETRDFDYQYVLTHLDALGHVNQDKKITNRCSIGLPRWRNARRWDLSTPLPATARPGRQLTLSVSASWPPRAPTTRRAWSTCLRATRLRRAARLTARAVRSIALWVPTAWRRSAR